MTPSERLERKQKIDNALTKARTELAQMRYHREAMAIAERRGELIERRLVTAQASYLMITFRQRMMSLSAAWCRRFVGLQNAHEAKVLIDEMARSTLTELASLPQKVTDPNWLERIEGNGQEEEEDRIAPASGSQIRTEQAKARVRRQKKTASEARRRARA